jgi:phytoene synthase
MWRTYHRLLDRIAEDPAAVAGHRIQLPKRERLGIATSHFVPFLFRRLPVPPREWADA